MTRDREPWPGEWSAEEPRSSGLRQARTSVSGRWYWPPAARRARTASPDGTWSRRRCSRKRRVPSVAQWPARPWRASSLPRRPHRGVAGGLLHNAQHLRCQAVRVLPASSRVVPLNASRRPCGSSSTRACRLSSSTRSRTPATTRTPSSTRVWGRAGCGGGCRLHRRGTRARHGGARRRVTYPNPRVAVA